MASETTPPGYAQEDRANWVTIPVIVLTPIVIILVSIRTWARHVMSGLALEDWVLLVALGFALVTDIMFITMVQHGYGLHLSVLDPPDKSFTLRTFWLAQMTYKMSLQATKISLLLFYIRIFHHIAWFKKVSYGVIAFLIVYLVTTCTVSIVQCRPIAKAWETDMDGTCIQVLQFFVFNGAVAVATDLIVLGLPLPLVWGLKLPLGQKLALIPVFGIGIFIVSVSTLRLHALIATPSRDTTFDLSGTLWTIIEFNLALVCASLPSVRVLLVKLFPRIFPGSALGRHRTGYGGGSSRAAGGGGASWNNKQGSSSSSGGGGGGWSKAHLSNRDRGHISLAGIGSPKRARDETSSDEIILQDHHGGIKRTMQYDVEYMAAR